MEPKHHAIEIRKIIWSIPVTLGSQNLLIFQGVRRPQWSGQIETSNQTNRRDPPNDGGSGLSAPPPPEV